MKQKKTWIRYLKTLLKMGITCVALYWVSTKVKPADVKVALLDSNPFYLFAAFISYAISQLCSSWRLNGFFEKIDLQLDERYNFKLYLLGLFYNMFLPGGVGGDGYKIYFLRKKFGIQGRKLLMAVLFDRLSGLWALALITSALVIFIPKLAIPNQVPILLVLLGTLLYYFMLKRFFPVFSQGWIVPHLKALGSWSFQIISVIFLLFALGFEGKFSPYLFTFLLSSLVAVFPFTVGGLGAREMANVFGAKYFLLDTHLAVLISLLFYLISSLLAVFGAYFILKPSALGEEKLPSAEEAESNEEEESPEETKTV
jgi:uncharacterized membrane protein YbhN (UPF0104 family)